MKTIGMIGGMSWESTVTYYKIVNERRQSINFTCIMVTMTFKKYVGKIFMGNNLKY